MNKERVAHYLEAYGLLGACQLIGLIALVQKCVSGF